MAESAAPEGLDALIANGVPAFARDFAAGFERDVDHMLSRAQARPGLRPRDEVLDLFRCRSKGIGERVFTRAALYKDTLNRISLTQRRITIGIASRGPTARASSRARIALAPMPPVKPRTTPAARDIAIRTSVSRETIFTLPISAVISSGTPERRVLLPKRKTIQA